MDRMLNPAHISEVLSLINQAPYFRLTGTHVCKLDLGYSRVETQVEDKHLNPFGIIHGGLFASLIDTACFWSAYCGLDEDQGLLTIDLNVNYLSPAFEGSLIAEARQIRAGKTVSLTEATVYNEEGLLLAQGTSKQMKSHGQQTMKQLLSNLGGISLPPKFLD